jgi:hypothetical protein
MAKSSAVKRQANQRAPAEDRSAYVRHFSDGQSATAANDNPFLDDLPCLPVTDDEVRLLHQYLSREILGLFS